MLDKVKQLLMKALILVSSTIGEPLLLYIAATKQVVSATLVVEREEEGHAMFKKATLGSRLGVLTRWATGYHLA